MTTISVSNFEKFHKIIQGYKYKYTIFRGVKKKGYPLIPKIGRIKDFKEGSRPYNEGLMFELFQERALPYLDRIPENDWQWLAVAQHFRLPTRLLDWTRNPLVAAYFAVEKKYNGDSAIYVIKKPLKRIKEKIIKNPLKIDPYDDRINNIAKYIPPHIVSRIIGQSSLFTYHRYPSKPYEGERSNLDKIIIKKNFRRELKTILYRYGIHEASLFSDLESLSHHIEWIRRDVHDINE